MYPTFIADNMLIRRLFISLLLIILTSRSIPASDSRKIIFQDSYGLFVAFESMFFNQQGLDNFLDGNTGQHHIMTINLKNTSGKDIKALYCTFYILDIVGPHSEIDNPLFVCRINSPHLFKTGLVQAVDVQASYNERGAMALRELLKRNTDAIDIIITNDDIILNDGRRFKHLVEVK